MYSYRCVRDRGQEKHTERAIIREADRQVRGGGERMRDSEMLTVETDRSNNREALPPKNASQQIITKAVGLVGFNSVIEE